MTTLDKSLARLLELAQMAQPIELNPETHGVYARCYPMDKDIEDYQKAANPQVIEALVAVALAAQYLTKAINDSPIITDPLNEVLDHLAKVLEGDSE